MTILTIETLDAIRDQIAAIEADSTTDTWERKEQLSLAFERLSPYAGTGEPRDAAAAEQMGPDYICALDDGRIVSWGGDYVSWPGTVSREIVVHD